MLLDIILWGLKLILPDDLVVHISIQDLEVQSVILLEAVEIIGVFRSSPLLVMRSSNLHSLFGRLLLAIIITSTIHTLFNI